MRDPAVRAARLQRGSEWNASNGGSDPSPMKLDPRVPMRHKVAEWLGADSDDSSIQGMGARTYRSDLTGLHDDTAKAPLITVAEGVPPCDGTSTPSPRGAANSPVFTGEKTPMSTGNDGSEDTEMQTRAAAAAQAIETAKQPVSEVTSMFSAACRSVAAISMDLQRPTMASAPHQVIKGFQDLVSIAMACPNYSFPLADKVIDMIENPDKYTTGGGGSGGGGGDDDETPPSAHSQPALGVSAPLRPGPVVCDDSSSDDDDLGIIKVKLGPEDQGPLGIDFKQISIESFNPSGLGQFRAGRPLEAGMILRAVNSVAADRLAYDA